MTPSFTSRGPSDHAKVIVIDDGRSFEHSSKLQNGEFVEFTMSSGFCLNPFSMIDEEEAKRDEDYRLDCIAMLKAIIGQLGRHIDRLDERSEEGRVGKECVSTGRSRWAT